MKVRAGIAIDRLVGLLDTDRGHRQDDRHRSGGCQIKAKHSYPHVYYLINQPTEMLHMCLVAISDRVLWLLVYDD